MWLTVDLNDAPTGLSLDEYRDDHRELPAATGVIPAKDFLGSLVQIDYDGPIQPEPFNAAHACQVAQPGLHQRLRRHEEVLQLL